MGNDILNFFKGKLALLIGQALEAKLNGKDLMVNLESTLDTQIGEKASERMQRKIIMNLLCEMQEGLYAESPADLIKEWEIRSHNLKNDLAGGV